MSTATKNKVRKTAKTIEDFPLVAEHKQRREELRDLRQELLSELNDDRDVLTRVERVNLERRIRETEREEQAVAHVLQSETLEAQRQLCQGMLPEFQQRVVAIDQALESLLKAHADLELFVRQVKVERGVSLAHFRVPGLVDRLSDRVRDWRGRCRAGKLLPKEDQR